MMVKVKSVICLFLFMVFYSNLYAQIQVASLRCEMLENPIGIDQLTPFVSWELESALRGVEQTAYQIIVSTTANKLEINDGDMWNSGKVNSSNSINVKYKGRVLKPNSYYYWKVKIWTTKGETSWSKPAFWQIGLTQFQDWKGRWIGFDRRFTWDGDPFGSRLSARYFRKEFDSPKKVKSAMAYIIGLGLYKLYINGEQIGNQVLAPVPTEYTKNVKYNTFDVTDHLRDGKNAIGITLGNGRYFTMRQFVQPYKIKNFGYPKVLFNLIITYEDGTVETIFTDDTWRGTADGPIRANNEYDGEEYDATKEMPGWNKVGFYDGRWLQAEYVQEPGGSYEAQMTEPMKVMFDVKPKSITKKENGRYILDLGQNMTGWLQLKVEGETGQKITLRYAESLDENDELFVANLRDAKAQSSYILKGEGLETYEPSFTYFGFRYVEILGYPDAPSIENFVGKMVYDNIKTRGTLETSDTLLNRIYKNAWWGIAGNYKGMPVDCPQRNERQPWLGDRGTGTIGENFIFDNARIYKKLLNDIKLAQKADGSLPDVAPDFWRYFSDNMTWPGVLLVIADMLYTQEADTTAIADNYVVMEKWLKYMKDRYMTDQYILTKDSYGDWCAPPPTIEKGRGVSSNVKHPSPLISSAYYYYFTKLMTKFSRIIGNLDAIQYYKEIGDKIRVGFQQAYYNPAGYYGNGELTSNLLPLAFDMIPDSVRSKVVDYTVDLVENKNHGHLSTGLIGQQWLMRTLSNIGKPDLALTIAKQRTYPSWGYMIENDATTIWELWNGNIAAPDMNSQNHVMMIGDLIVWYYESLAGIKSDPYQVGFKRIIMKPLFNQNLSFIKATYHGTHGSIKSDWRKNGGKINWDITIPPNSKAKIYIPVSDINSITESEVKLTAIQPDIKLLGMENGTLVFEILSGNYFFKF